MAESSPRAGEKRSGKCKADEKRPPKVRRFDVKVRVPKTETSSAISTEKGEKNDSHMGTKRGIVTTIVTKSESSGSDTSVLAAERATGASERLWSVDVGSQELEETKSGHSSKSVVEMPSNSTVPETMSVNKMLQTSLGLSQPDAGKNLREERGLGYGKNIVDQLFQEFVTTKMREVDDRLNASMCEDNADSAQAESEKNQVAESIEEMSRLLDAEITSIKSRNVVAGLTEEDMVLSGFSNSDMIRASLFSRSVEVSKSTSEVPAVGDVMSPSVTEPSQSSAPGSVSVVEVFSEGMDMTATLAESAFKEASGFSGAEGTGVLIRKKAEPKKLGLSIRPESLALITGSFKNGRALEDGEVASSTDSDGDKAFKKVEEIAEESNDSGEVSGTGSLSDSDRGKDGKAKKKKKKHKHKHKKKKKHKSQSKEKDKVEDEEEKSSHPKERRSSRERKERKASKEEKSERKSSKERKESEDTSKRDSKESKSKDRKKSSHKSKSPEDFDPWDARNYRMDGSRHRSPSSPQSSKSRHRDRSKDRHRDRSKDRTREGSKERHHRHKHSSHSKEHSRKRSRSKEKEKEKEKGASGDEAAKDKDKDLRVKIDKNKLRKIAIARALANMEKGKGPSVDLTLAKSGGKSVAELTEFCKRISQKEMANQSSDSGEVSEEEKSDAEDGPFHHPFITRDLSTAPNIVMNIRNAKQLPVLTPQEKQMQAATLRTQFPVSSGTQHRSKESEWVPVTTTTPSTTTTTTSTPAAAAPAKATPAASTSVPSAAASMGMMATPSVQPAAVAVPVASLKGTTLLPTPTPALAPAPTPAAPGPQDESVFPSVDMDMDIGSIVSERIQAMRRLQQNPFDLQALNSVHRMNEQANAWAQSKHLPGQFTGTTDIKILTQEELAGPDKRNQAWAKKDQFRKAPPVQGVGMFLLQKMGWKPGDGLGKDNEGKKEPLMLDVKMDRKGLSTSLDHRPMQPMVRPPPPHFGPGMHQPPPPPPPLAAAGAGGAGGAPVPQRAKDLSGKHPVSALTELCTKRRWGAPAFEVASETGPAHKRMFLFKVRVNGVEYQPAAACGNKKLAKAQSAAVCLQEMGLIPRDFVVQV